MRDTDRVGESKCVTGEATMKRRYGQSVRRRSSTILFGRPAIDIALGPDPDKGEVFGHAKGIIAIGDVATGWLAIGGVARGFFAIGGLSLGLFTFGGLSVGAVALGGLAIGLVALGGAAIGALAVGGAAVGIVAVGGGAVGYYACGGGAAGRHIITATEHSQEAVDFFHTLFPFTAH